MSVRGYSTAVAMAAFDNTSVYSHGRTSTFIVQITTISIGAYVCRVVWIGSENTYHITVCIIRPSTHIQLNISYTFKKVNK